MLTKTMSAKRKIVSTEPTQTNGGHDSQTIRSTIANPGKYSLVVATILAATLIAGLQHFVLTLPKATTDRLQFTDGIIVMTGGQQRLSDGVSLLTEGFADKMLISGVGKGVNRAILVQEL